MVRFVDDAQVCALVDLEVDVSLELEERAAKQTQVSNLHGNSVHAARGPFEMCPDSPAQETMGWLCCW